MTPQEMNRAEQAGETPRQTQGTLPARRGLHLGNAVLRVSVLANVILGALLTYRAVRPEPVPPANPPVPIGSPRLPVPAARARIEPSLPGPAQVPTPWAAIESDDPATLLARLQATGCPPSIQRDLVTLRVARQHRERTFEIEHELAKRTPWWLPGTTTTGSAERQALRRQRMLLRWEWEETLERLFGEPAHRIRLRVAGRNPDLLPDGLSPDERLRLARVFREFITRGNDLNQDHPPQFMAGPVPPALQEARDAWRTEREAAIVAALSPAGYLEYQMRHSPEARYVHRNLPPASSEAEFRDRVLRVLESGMLPPQAPTSLADRYGIGSPGGPSP